MSYMDKAVEAAAKALSEDYLTAPGKLPDEFGEGAITTNKATAHAGAVRALRAAEPAIAEHHRKEADKKLIECEETLRSTEASYAQFRDDMLKEIRGDTGGSIETLSWDALLGVAVRNGNEAMKQADRATQAEAAIDQARKDERSKVEAALLSDEALCAFEMHGRTVSMSPPGAVELDELRVRMTAALKVSTEEGAALASHPNRDDESGRLAAFQALTEGDFFNFTDPEHQSEYVWRYVDAVLDAYLAALKVSTEGEGDGPVGEFEAKDPTERDIAQALVRSPPDLRPRLFRGIGIDIQPWDQKVAFAEARSRGRLLQLASALGLAQPQQEEQTSPEEER